MTSDQKPENNDSQSNPSPSTNLPKLAGSLNNTRLFGDQFGEDKNGEAPYPQTRYKSQQVRQIEPPHFCKPCLGATDPTNEGPASLGKSIVPPDYFHVDRNQAITQVESLGKSCGEVV